MTLVELVTETVRLSTAYRQLADVFDTEFLNRTDPRALQGGAICEEASELRTLAKGLLAIANRCSELQ
jgi:hypothetical protein